MKKYAFCGCIVALFLVVVLMNSCSGGKSRTIEIKNSSIYLDGKYTVVASAEIDYARIPEEYWEQRLGALAYLGVNTITVKVPWMLHEPVEGEFNFKGMNDLSKFCKLAQKKDLLVWLHVGPYVGAEWDMGGLPWWLLNVDGIELRSNQPAFMQRVERYFAALSNELAPLMLTNGGNIAIIQIEEAQGLEKNDRGYLQALCECAKRVGLGDVLTFTSANRYNFLQTSVDGVDFSLEINSKEKAEEHFSGITKYRYDAPHVCSSIGGDYKTVWGGESANRNWDKVFMRMYELLQRGTSLSVNGIVAGTSFGCTAGASMADGTYKPYTTSHNSDGFLKLWGGLDNKMYDLFHRSLYIYAQEEGKKFQRPELVDRLSKFPEFAVTDFAPLFSNLPEPVEAKRPLTMEKIRQGYGAVLYSATLPATGAGTTLIVKDVHDFARIFIDGVPIGVLDRRNNESEIELPPVKAGAKLDILVDATGRVTDVKGYKDYKGITDGVVLRWANGSSNELTDWKMYPLPSDYSFAASKNFTEQQSNGAPGYYRATFDKPGPGDFFLYVGTWGKGEIWLNGKSLGRFWGCGPQYTLYVPGCWLKEKDNEIIIADWLGPEMPVLKGIDYSFM